MGKKVVLTSRDVDVLRWVAAQRCASLDDLAVVLGRRRGPGVRASAGDGEREVVGSEDEGGVEADGGPMKPAGVQRIVKRWVDAGVVERWRPLTSAGPLVLVTPEGARLVGVRGTRRPGLGGVEHVLAVNRVRLAVEAETRGRWVWLGEPELAGRFGIVPGPGGAHLPDAVLVPVADEGAGARDCVAVEVERSSKSRARWARILRESLGRWGQVWYVAETPELLARVRSVAEDQDEKGAALRAEDRDRLVWSVVGEPVPTEVGGQEVDELEELMG